MLIRRQIPKGQVLAGGALDPPRTHDAHAIAIEQQPHHRHRVIRRLPAPITPSIKAIDPGHVQANHQFRDEARQMILRQPVLQRGWQQKWLIQITRSEALAHKTRIKDTETFVYENVLSKSRMSRQSISDRLLVQRPLPAAAPRLWTTLRASETPPLDRNRPPAYHPRNTAGCSVCMITAEVEGTQYDLSDR